MCAFATGVRPHCREEYSDGCLTPEWHNLPAEHLHDWPVAERSAIMLYVRTDVNKALSKALPAPAVYSAIELHPAPLNHFCVFAARRSVLMNPPWFECIILGFQVRTGAFVESNRARLQCLYILCACWSQLSQANNSKERRLWLVMSMYSFKFVAAQMASWFMHIYVQAWAGPEFCLMKLVH